MSSPFVACCSRSLKECASTGHRARRGGRAPSPRTARERPDRAAGRAYALRDPFGPLTHPAATPTRTGPATRVRREARRGRGRGRNGRRRGGGRNGRRRHGGRAPGSGCGCGARVARWTNAPPSADSSRFTDERGARRHHRRPGRPRPRRPHPRTPPPPRPPRRVGPPLAPAPGAAQLVRPPPALPPPVAFPPVRARPGPRYARPPPAVLARQPTSTAMPATEAGAAGPLRPPGPQVTGRAPGVWPNVRRKTSMKVLAEDQPQRWATVVTGTSSARRTRAWWSLIWVRHWG